MPVIIKPTSVIKARLGLEPNGRAQKFFTNTCYKHMDKYVPMDNGDLRNEHSLTANSITYEMPYAHAQYVGYTTGEVKNYTTPGTGTYWDKRMVSAEMVDVIKEVQNYINRGGK